MKEELKNAVARIAVKYKLSYVWSGGTGLLALIVSVMRLAANYPHLPTYIQPTQLSSAPTGLPAQPSVGKIRDANDTNDILNRDWVVVSGFIRAMGENIWETVDTKFVEDL